MVWGEGGCFDDAGSHSCSTSLVLVVGVFSAPVTMYIYGITSATSVSPAKPPVSESESEGRGAIDLPSSTPQRPASLLAPGPPSPPGLSRNRPSGPAAAHSPAAANAY